MVRFYMTQPKVFGLGFRWLNSRCLTIFIYMYILYVVNNLSPFCSKFFKFKYHGQRIGTCLYNPKKEILM